jgi:hypothetical protein
MTDRIKGFYVALDHDYRTDDAQAILDAISMIRGVIAVTAEIATGDDWMNRQRIQLELRKRVLDVLRGAIE